MDSKPLSELLNRDEPAITLIRQWVESAELPVEVLSPSVARDEVLLEVQITTRSPLGAIAYETGGILVDYGWLRFLGSGHPRLNRTLSNWNRGRANGFFLVADDAVGGFFAINGGALGDKTNSIYYLSPDGLEWESLNMGFSDFFCCAITSRMSEFYKGLRWPTWQGDVRKLSGDQCFGFFPFLWAQEGSVQRSNRRPIPVEEAFDVKVDIVGQLQRE